MSDLNKLWKEISDKSALLDQAPLEREGRLQPSPFNLLRAIQTRNRLKVYLLYAYLIACVVLLFFLESNWESYSILGTMFLFGLVNLWLVLPAYLAMKRQNSLMSGSSLEVLKFYHGKLQTMIRRENLIGAIFAPFASMLGFLWAFIEKKGTAAGIFSDGRLLAIMLGMAVIITPLGAWMVVWMNRKAFGKYLDYLEENIAQLKEE